jgi:hypothetical protein
MRVNAWNRAKTFHWSKILPEASDWLEEMARSGWKNNPEHLK